MSTRTLQQVIKSRLDTAAVYGLGHSEELVRQALRGIPADRRPYVFTKYGLI